jgi:hypothetical protein
VVERFEIEGPWEVTLALRDTRRAVLGNVAGGWQEPEHAFPRDVLPRCPDDNVLVRREVFEWPDADAQRSLAFDIGGAIEDGFGVEQRRFLARKLRVTDQAVSLGAVLLRPCLARVGRPCARADVRGDEGSQLLHDLGGLFVVRIVTGALDQLQA